MENGHDTTPLVIRDAGLLDLPAIRTLYATLLAEKAPAYPTIDDEEIANFVRCMAQCLTMPGHEERWPGWVAELDGQVIGFLFGEHEIRVIGKPHDVYVAHWMVVDPAYRGCGVGRALVARGLEWVMAKGIPLVELASFAGDTQWEGRGWTPLLTRYVCPTTQIAATLAAHGTRPAPQAEGDDDGRQRRHADE